MVVLGYPDIAAAGDAVPAILPHQPWQLEGLDQVLLSSSSRPSLAGEAIGQLPAGGGWLMVAVRRRRPGRGRRQGAGAARRRSSGTEHAPHVKFLDDPAKEERLVEVREAGLGATAHPAGQHETWEGWEDAAVPPERLGDYLRDFRALLDEFGYAKSETSLYGHFGQGCVHTRIPFELRTARRHRRTTAPSSSAPPTWSSPTAGRCPASTATASPAASCCRRCSATEVVDAVRRRSRRSSTRDDRMNPGKVVDPNPLDGQLRLGTDYAPRRADDLLLATRRTTTGSPRRPCAASGSATAATTRATSR